VTTIARIISIVFHPLLMATYLFLLLSFTLPTALAPIPGEGHLRFILIIFIMTFVVPVMNVGFFKIMGSVRSLDFYERRDRVIPFSIFAIFYAAITYFFYAKFRIDLTDNVFKIMIVLDTLVLVSAVITFFYKISIHTLCVWGFIGIILFLNKASDTNLLLIPSVAMFLVAGAVMASRLQLNAHTPSEIWLGAAVGFVISFAGMNLLF